MLFQEEASWKTPRQTALCTALIVLSHCCSSHTFAGEKEGASVEFQK